MAIAPRSTESGTQFVTSSGTIVGGSTTPREVVKQTFFSTGGGSGGRTEQASTQISSAEVIKEPELQISPVQQQGLTQQQKFIAFQRGQIQPLFLQQILQQRRERQLKEGRKLLVSEEKPEKKTDEFFEKIKERDIEIEEQRAFERETSFKELYEIGDLPAIVRKAFRGGATEFLSFEERVLGKKLPEDVKVKAGEFIGETILFAGVLGPVTTTGTTGVKEKTITLQEVLSKDRFGAGLDKSLAAKSILETKVAKIKTQKGQIKFLTRIKGRITDPIAKKSFEKFTQELLKKNILKPTKLLITKEGKILVPKINTKSKDLIVYVAEKVPKMKGTGFIAKLTTLPIKTPEPTITGMTITEEIEKQVKELKQIPKVTPILSGAVAQIPKQIPKQFPRQIPKQSARQIPRLAQPSLSLEVPRFKQPTQQIFKQPPIRKIKPRRKIPKFPIIPFPFQRIKQEPQRAGSFTVLLRRFGKFKPIGRFPTLRQAKEVGRLAAVRGLGATFKIPEAKKISIPKGFRGKQTKKGFEIIELPKFRLSTPTEIKEIQAFKRRRR